MVDMLTILEPDFIVLLNRVNAVAKALSGLRHGGETKWIAEVKLQMIHGIGALEALEAHPPLTERFEVKIEIRSDYYFRRLTLEEAELIVQSKPQAL